MPAEGSHMVRRGVLFPSQRICCAFSLQALAHRPLHVSRLPRPPLMLTTHSMRGGGETLTATNGRVRWRAATGDVGTARDADESLRWALRAGSHGASMASESSASRPAFRLRTHAGI